MMGALITPVMRPHMVWGLFHSAIFEVSMPSTSLNRRSLLALAGATAAFTAVRTNGVAFQTTSATPAAPAPASINPASAALLVMDYQPRWLATLDDPDAVVSQAATAIATARERGIEVVYAWVAFTAADYAAVPEGNVIFQQIARPDGVLDTDLPDVQIDPRVEPLPSDKVVRKTRVSAFERTDLDAWLRGMGIDTLILSGISTSGVVLSTVCDAADMDYRVLVLADACADRSPEIQQVLTEQVFPQRAEVIRVAEFTAA